MSFNPIVGAESSAAAGGGATEATQLLVKADVDKIPSQGQAAMAASVPVVIASNQSTVPVDVSDKAARIVGQLTDGSATYVAAKTGQLPTALVGGRLDENVGAWLGATTPTVGQKTAAASLPVIIASDQTLPLPTNAAIETGGHLASLDTKDFATQATLALVKADVDKIPSQGQALMAASMPVVVASDQTVAVSVASLPLPSGAATEATMLLRLKNIEETLTYLVLLTAERELDANHS